MLYVRNEYSYDKFNTNYERIYRFEQGDAESVHLPSAMGLDAQDWFPEIEKVVRFKSWGNQVLSYKNNTFKIPHTMLVDSSFFDVFTVDFIQGDPKTVFETPYSIVLTEKIARMFFGNQDPVGEILTTPEGQEVEVKGIIKDLPNFHMQIDVLLPFNLLGVINNQEYLRSYGTWQFQTYFLLPNQFDYKNLESKLENKLTERFAQYLDEGEIMDFTLRPLKDVYFAHHTRLDFGAVHGNKNNVKLFLAIGIFIILIACINFINLTTAKAASRATEVGIRKVHGGHKKQLIFQFLSESVLLTFISFLIAITLVQILTPYFNNLVQKELTFQSIFNYKFLIISLAGIIATGVFAGVYPAFYLTAFNPVKVLKGEKTKGKSAAIFRRILIVIQFTISVSLIASTLTVQKQLKFLREKDMGFQKDNIIALTVNNTIRSQKESFKEKLLKHPEIVNVSYSGGIIGTMSNSEGLDINSDGELTNLQLHPIDPNYIDLYNIKVIKGRNFSFDNPSDARQKVILNEEAVKRSGLEPGKAVGTIFHRDSWYLTALPSKECEVIGVVKNFNYRSLHEPIGPQGLVWNDKWFYVVNIKIKPGTLSKSLKLIENIYSDYSENVPFEYILIDDHIKSLYKSDYRLGRFFIYFSVVAIIIAMLGLFGLAAFITESRTKEIGIRKALGSSTNNILILMSKEFIKWVFVANIIAVPIAYYGMNKWLQTFVYKIKLTPEIFIFSLIISVVIALTTVFYQTYKASRRNPAKALRYE
jgi:putative ABC transport system permease protein